jgi:hypothetical protein
MKNMIHILVISFGIICIVFGVFILASPHTNENITIKTIYPSYQGITVITTDENEFYTNYKIGSELLIGHTYSVDINNYWGVDTPGITKIYGEI